MISTPIRITKQEVLDFPVHTLRCNEKWNDLIDPKHDHMFQAKKKKK